MADSSGAHEDTLTVASRKIWLRSGDNELFVVDREVAFRSDTVKQMVQDVEESAAEKDIPLGDVSGEILARVIEYCTYHVEADRRKKEKAKEDGDDDKDDADDNEEVEEEEEDYDDDKRKPKEANDEVSLWDKEFVNVEQHILFDLIKAANYLHVKDLLNFLIQTVADMIIACKDPAEIRAKFNIPDDLTPEEVEEIKRKNTWAFE